VELRVGESGIWHVAPELCLVTIHSENEGDGKDFLLLSVAASDPIGPGFLFPQSRRPIDEWGIIRPARKRVSLKNKKISLSWTKQAHLWVFLFSDCDNLIYNIFPIPYSVKKYTSQKRFPNFAKKRSPLFEALVDFFVLGEKYPTKVYYLKKRKDFSPKILNSLKSAIKAGNLLDLVWQRKNDKISGLDRRMIVSLWCRSYKAPLKSLTLNYEHRGCEWKQAEMDESTRFHTQRNTGESTEAPALVAIPGAYFLRSPNLVDFVSFIITLIK
jgi:hypothetical protein